MLIYIAPHLLPVVSAPVAPGAVAVEEGRVVDAGPRDEVLAQHGEAAEVRDLGSAVMIPGLVNAHTHLELSWMQADPPRGADYASWLRGLLERRDGEDAETVRAAAQRAVDFILSRGTVAVADVANGIGTAPLLARSGLHAIVFLEVLGLRATQAEEILERAVGQLEALAGNRDLASAGDRVRVELTPHAPHTTSAPLLRALAGRSAASAEPLTLHVAESLAETALLRDGSGPFPALYRERGFWDDEWSPPGQSPIEYLDRLGVLSDRTLAVHCVHLGQRDHSILQARRSTVVTCPRSNRQLGVGQAPVPTLMAKGIPVTLGTDSVASSPDLDMFKEMAALREEHPSLKPAAVLRMATLNGAQALGLDDRLGSIEPGKLAELVVVPLASEDDDPLEAVCSDPAVVHRLAEAPWKAVS